MMGEYKPCIPIKEKYRPTELWKELPNSLGSASKGYTRQCLAYFENAAEHYRITRQKWRLLLSVNAVSVIKYFKYL